MDTKKLLSILGMAGVAVHAATLTASPVNASASPAQLEEILQANPLSDDASSAFDILAARFKDKGDKGRPDSFGPPGPPDIGPPGQYEG